MKTRIEARRDGGDAVVTQGDEVTPLPLTEDEFRLLAYIRAYADHRDQGLDPGWVREQLEFSLKQLQAAARGLAARGLAEFFEWRPDDARMVPPEYGDGPIPMNIRLTHKGWGCLRPDLGTMDNGS